MIFSGALAGLCAGVAASGLLTISSMRKLGWISDLEYLWDKPPWPIRVLLCVSGLVVMVSMVGYTWALWGGEPQGGTELGAAFGFLGEVVEDRLLRCKRWPFKWYSITVVRDGGRKLEKT